MGRSDLFLIFASVGRWRWSGITAQDNNRVSPRCEGRGNNCNNCSNSRNSRDSSGTGSGIVSVRTSFSNDLDGNDCVETLSWCSRLLRIVRAIREFPLKLILKLTVWTWSVHCKPLSRKQYKVPCGISIVSEWCPWLRLSISSTNHKILVHL